ncbi:MAG: hypothetical protein MUQ10_00115 [Anaerolineae bacterium]|nr:hypothetical protein [Anaerolineae bacterium]
MIDVLVWLIKLPFVLVGWILALVLGLVGVILLIVGAGLTPVLGIGLLLLPFALLFLLLGRLIRKLL